MAPSNIITFKILLKLPSEISKNRFDHILKIPMLIIVVGTLIIFLWGQDEDNKTLDDVFAYEWCTGLDWIN